MGGLSVQSAQHNKRVEKKNQNWFIVQFVLVLNWLTV